MKTPTLNAFKTWAISHRPLALAVCKAQAFAEYERERVNAYITPIFHQFHFKANNKITERDPDFNRPLTTPEALYLSDDLRIPDYYAHCDAAHRSHGFKGPEGHCPALIAEHIHIQAENALLEEAQDLLGVDPSSLEGKTREEMLTLLLSACLTEEEPTTRNHSINH